tara:strand:- start:571 stop:1176 length:606 start_codon:yes stop_codon:yes gene_type:complete
VDIVQDIEVLSKPCSPVSLSKGMEIGEKLVAYLKENRNRWVGLAANQIGIDARVFAIALQGNFAGEYKYLINPEIIDTSSETFVFSEGCLSFPNKQVMTNRYRSITVKADNLSDGGSLVFYADPSPDKYDLQLECACVQHEIDHLNGITMYDRKATPTVHKGPTIGRNQRVIITNGTEERSIKHKKAEQLLNNGWSIKEIL